MQDVKAWLLSSGDFVAGVKLLEMHAGSSFFTKLFHQQGPSPYNIKKLRSELEKLEIPEIPIIPIVPVKDSGIIPIIPKNPAKPHQGKHIGSDAHQLTYLRLTKDRDATYRALDHNNAALDFSTDPDVLFETAVKMKSLWRKLQRIHTKLDYFAETGTFPEDVPEKEVITPEMQRLYVSIWKAEERLKKGECRNKFKTEALLKQKRERLQELKDNA